VKQMVLEPWSSLDASIPLGTWLAWE